jgi:hypothetical protein
MARLTVTCYAALYTHDCNVTGQVGCSYRICDLNGQHDMYGTSLSIVDGPHELFQALADSVVYTIRVEPPLGSCVLGINSSMKPSSDICPLTYAKIHVVPP